MGHSVAWHNLPLYFHDNKHYILFFCSDHEVHGGLADVQASERDRDCIQPVEGGYKRVIYICNSNVILTENNSKDELDNLAMMYHQNS